MADQPFLCDAWDDKPPADPLAGREDADGAIRHGSANAGACCRAVPEFRIVA